MKKTVTIFPLFVFFLVSLSGCLRLAPVQDSAKFQTQSPSPETNGSSDTVPSDVPESSSGVYQDFTESAFEAAKGKTRILFFHAKWCPTCRDADRTIQENVQQLPENIVIFKTDYDTQKDLIQKHGVTYQHTFVIVDELGNTVDVWNGGDIPEILERVQ